VHASLERSGRETAVRLEGVRAGSGTHFDLEHVEVWEVDWDFDGIMFRSRSQAARAWRSPELTNRLSPRETQATGKRVAVRAVDQNGHVGIAVLTKPAAEPRDPGEVAEE
jgi:hypothetical protein